MSNMSSASSTRKGKRPRRSAWRACVVLLLLLATVAYSVLLVRRAAPRLDAARAADELPVAGIIAEALESDLTEGPLPDPDQLAPQITILFQNDARLAAVRVWDGSAQLICETTSQAPARASGEAVLPDLQAQAAINALAPRLADASWTDVVAQFQLLESEQRNLIAQMEKAVEAKGEAKADEDENIPVAMRQDLYGKQDAILEVAQTLQQQLPILGTAIKDIDAVFSAITESDTTLEPARLAAVNVLSDFTDAFTRYRAVTNVTPALPKALTASAPTPPAWWNRMSSVVAGHRVLVPLFTPAETEQLVAPAGTVELIFFTRPTEVLDVLRPDEMAPAGIMLALACIILLWPRKRRRQRDEDDLTSAE